MNAEYFMHIIGIRETIKCQISTGRPGKIIGFYILKGIRTQ